MCVCMYSKLMAVLSNSSKNPEQYAPWFSKKKAQQLNNDKKKILYTTPHIRIISKDHDDTEDWTKDC